jgi:quercetin dioxygenase-like cupin family protein
VDRLPADLERLDWTDPDPPNPERVAARLRAEGVEPYAWSNGPGDEYATHRHGYTKLLMCAAGSITFRIGPEAEPVDLRAGEGFILPPGTPHSATVGPHGCTCIEGHVG